MRLNSNPDDSQSEPGKLARTLVTIGVLVLVVAIFGWILSLGTHPIIHNAG